MVVLGAAGSGIDICTSIGVDGIAIDCDVVIGSKDFRVP